MSLLLTQIEVFLWFLLWGQIGVPGENPPVRPCDHTLSYVAKPGIEPWQNCREARALTSRRTGQFTLTSMLRTILSKQ